MGKQAVVRTTSELAELIEKSGLVIGKQLEQAKLACAESADIKSAARRLISEKLITLWQAKQLLVGIYTLKLGKFKLTDELGQPGRHGRTYLAENANVGRKVALKILARHHNESPDAVENFTSEARGICGLDHPNIVHVNDVGSEGDRFYVVMEYINGKNLQDLVNEQGPQDSDAAVKIIRQVASVLAHAHENKVVHLDLEPSNILIDKAGAVKVLDTGFSKLNASVEPAEDGVANWDESKEITPFFRAPEQQENDADGDERSDLYSLGAVLYYLLTGQPPAAEKVGEVWQKKNRFSAANSLKENLPNDLRTLCVMLLSGEPNLRFQSANEVLEAIDGIANSSDLNNDKATDTVSLKVDETISRVPAKEPVSTTKKPPIVAKAGPPPVRKPPIKAKPVAAKLVDDENGLGSAVTVLPDFTPEELHGSGSHESFAVQELDLQDLNLSDEGKSTSGSTRMVTTVKKPAVKSKASKTKSDDENLKKNPNQKVLIFAGVAAAALFLAIISSVGAYIAFSGPAEKTIAQTGNGKSGKEGKKNEGRGSKKGSKDKVDKTEVEKAKKSGDETEPQKDSDAAKNDAKITEATATPTGNELAKFNANPDPANGLGGAKAAAPTEPLKAEIPATTVPAATPMPDPVLIIPAPMPTIPPVQAVPTPKPEPAKPAVATRLPAPKSAPLKLAATAFQNFPTFVELPPISGGDSAEALAIGGINIDKNAFCSMYLIGGEATHKGAKVKFAIEDTDTAIPPREWTVFVRDKNAEKGGTKLATLALKDDSKLWFSWLPEAAPPKSMSNFLGNCVLKISAGVNTQKVALRKPLEKKPFTVDVWKQTTKDNFVIPNAPDLSKVYIVLSVESGASKYSYDQSREFKPDAEGTAVVFGEKDREYPLKMYLEAKAKQKFDISVAAFYQFNGLPAVKLKPEDKKNGVKNQLLAARNDLEQKINFGKASLASIPDPMQKAAATKQVKEWEVGLKSFDTAIPQVEDLERIITAVNGNAKIHYEVVYKADEEKIVLVSTNPPPD